MKTLVVIACTAILVVTTLIIYRLLRLVYKAWLKKQLLMAEQAKRAEEARLQAEIDRKELLIRLGNILHNDDSMYTRMLIISCYVKVGDLGTSVNEETKRLVHVCNEVDDTLLGIKFDWVVYYEPRKNPYTEKTLSVIAKQPKEKTLRLSCGCSRERSEDYRCAYGGENSDCGSFSNDNVHELRRCWLKNTEATSYSRRNSNSFTKDLIRLNACR